MKIKLIEQGYDKFSGHFGTVLFEDGVSVHDVSDQEIRLLAAIIQVRSVDDGSDPGANAQFQSSLKMEAQTVNLPTQAELDRIAQAAKPEETKKEAPVVGYTREELEQIADKSGITGLREIGDKFDVKATSISKLIAAILDAQARQVVTASE
jgi:hypothetical protein